MTRYLGCRELRELGIVPEGVDCCGSCHHEWEDEVADPSEIDLDAEHVAMVCCEVASWLRENVSYGVVTFDDDAPSMAW